jgi:integrase/recombinase XerD
VYNDNIILIKGAKPMLNQFSTYLTNQNLSPNTIKSYLADLTLYFNFLKSQSISTTNAKLILNRKNIQQYKNYRILQGTDAKTINRDLSSLKRYNEFLIDKNYQSEMCIIKSDYIKIQKEFTSPTDVTLPQTINFIKKIKDHESYRNYAIAIICVNAGLRISEVLNIKLINLSTLDSGIIKIIGKGNKQRKIVVNNTAISVIKEYIANYRNNDSIYANESPYLFVSQKGEKLSSCTIERIFNKYSKKTSNNRHEFTPHKLRHVFSTNSLENEKIQWNIRQLQQQLGHVSLNTTAIYTLPNEKNMKAKLNNACINV